MFMLGENEKRMNYLSSPSLLYGEKQSRDMHASYIKACEYAQLTLKEKLWIIL